MHRNDYNKCFKKPLRLYTDFHREELWNFLNNLFIWEGMPETIDLRFFNSRLLKDGYITAFDVKSDIVCSEGSIHGLDQYYRPTKFESANIIFNNVKRDIGKNAVVCYNTLNYRTPESCTALVEIFARRLAELDISVDTSCKNSRVCLVPVVNDAKEAIRVGEMLTKMYEGEPAVLNYKTAFGGGVDIVPIRAKDNIVVTELADARRNIYADFFSYLGIDTVAVDKKERTNLAEMESNAQQLHINSCRLLASRQLFCEEMKKVFGVDMSVRLNIEEVKKYAESKMSSGDDPES